ncbi:MAG: putative sulfate exporter family transporter [Flavobacteriales bacterium]|nr:putative sulfate exporter family transporter [Flavobacteriales bacterium]
MKPAIKEKYIRIIFVLLMVLCIVPGADLQPFLSPPLALLLGVIVANTIGNPFDRLSSAAVKLLLKVSIVGLGFGIHAEKAMQAGSKGIVLTIFSIAMTLTLGYFLGKKLKMDKKTSYLISGGTSICGGSAIAAISPLVKADDSQISIALGTVFILNAVALFVFPPLGHLLELSQQEFGTWAAVAIHDTSSVVGAAAAYGHDAEATATTLKLARALWIIPLSFFTLWLFKTKGAKVSIPWFILLFVVAIGINTIFPQFTTIYKGVNIAAHQVLILTLFLIGAGLSRTKLKNVGIRPLILGICLWVVISVVSLSAILFI